MRPPIRRPAVGVWTYKSTGSASVPHWPMSEPLSTIDVMSQTKRTRLPTTPRRLAVTSFAVIDVTVFA